MSNFAAGVTEERLLDAAPSVRVCNCAGCGTLLVSDDERERKPVAVTKGIPVLFGRVKGRPLCRPCYGDGGYDALTRAKR